MAVSVRAPLPGTVLPAPAMTMRLWRAPPNLVARGSQCSLTCCVPLSFVGVWSPGVVRNRWPAPGHRQLLTARAASDAGGGLADAVLTYGSVSLGIIACTYSIFYDWRSVQLPGSKPARLTGSDEHFTWALMCALSCLPLFCPMVRPCIQSRMFPYILHVRPQTGSTALLLLLLLPPQAWVLGALSSEQPRPFYWAAAFYALPLLHSGLETDGLAAALLLVSALHMQALRIGATEPGLQTELQQRLAPLALMRGLKDAGTTVARAAIGGDNSRSSGAKAAAIPRSSAGDSLQQGERESGDESAVMESSRRELEEFDRRLADRQQNADTRSDKQHR
jgi:hypothetical protein